MKNDIQNILDMFVQEMKNYFGNSICEIIVYGSYARGDFNENSDIDIMILVNITETDIKKYEDRVPFYRNIKREGVKVA